MKIGITCYPIYGGSGVVATELGKALAARGHSVHFISYSMPFRLAHIRENIFFHEVDVNTYPLFEYPPYTLNLTSKMVDVVKRYLDITDKQVVVEVEGHTADEMLEVGRFFAAMSDQVIIKIPSSVDGLRALRALSQDGVETFCTTVFSLPQAAAFAQAGADHILPFCEPVKEMGGDPTKLVRECVRMFSGWEQRPYVMAALVRSVETAYAAFRDGAD
ncbi:MAG: hypothetical protein IIA50_02765, partial [Bacteroidetes bacterium]|nr:hypothetical protein [Bacteroidota bacterium]